MRTLSPVFFRNVYRKENARSRMLRTLIYRITGAFAGYHSSLHKLSDVYLNISSRKYFLIKVIADINIIKIFRNRE